MRKIAPPMVLLSLPLTILFRTACDVNPYDPAQKPKSRCKKSRQLQKHPNRISSPVRYASAPAGSTTDVVAGSLVPGETYSVEVTQNDPKGSGDGFTNTRNRYLGVTTFKFTARSTQ